MLAGPPVSTVPPATAYRCFTYVAHPLRDAVWHNPLKTTTAAVPVCLPKTHTHTQILYFEQHFQATFCTLLQSKAIAQAEHRNTNKTHRNHPHQPVTVCEICFRVRFRQDMRTSIYVPLPQARIATKWKWNTEVNKKNKTKDILVQFGALSSFVWVWIPEKKYEKEIKKVVPKKPRCGEKI